MKIIDLYILKKLLTTFLFVMFIILLIILIIDITEKINAFNKPEVSLKRIFSYYASFIPWILNYIAPITTFIATVIVTANMASHAEFIAIFAGGISFNRILLPYFLLALFVAFISFYFNGWLIPKANINKRAFEAEFIESKYFFAENNFHLQAGPTEYLYLQRYDNSNNIGYNFTLEKIEDSKLKEKFSAQQIIWNDSAQRWKIKLWNHRVILDESEKITSGNSLDSTLAIFPKDFQSQHHLWEILTLPELTKKIDELKQRGLSGAKTYKAEKYFRYTMPFTVFLLVIMGVIVSSKKTRGGTGLQIAIGFIISFVFIVFVITSRGIAEGGVMPPIVAVWIPNILFSFVAIYMYKQRLK